MVWEHANITESSAIEANRSIAWIKFAKMCLTPTPLCTTIKCHLSISRHYHNKGTFLYATLFVNILIYLISFKKIARILIFTNFYIVYYFYD